MKKLLTFLLISLIFKQFRLSRASLSNPWLKTTKMQPKNEVMKFKLLKEFELHVNYNDG